MGKKTLKRLPPMIAKHFSHLAVTSPNTPDVQKYVINIPQLIPMVDF
ncbi:MAG: hypothetical protein VKJ02_02205 [Snowella sp.]|nr:hypothetical protein [Snowella sp.]